MASVFHSKPLPFQAIPELLLLRSGLSSSLSHFLNYYSLSVGHKYILHILLPLFLPHISPFLPASCPPLALCPTHLCSGLLVLATWQERSCRERPTTVTAGEHSPEDIQPPCPLRSLQQARLLLRHPHIHHSPSALCSLDIPLWSVTTHPRPSFLCYGQFVSLSFYFLCSLFLNPVSW